MRRPTHTCNYCSRSFKRAEHLTRHLRTHTREKPYICQCGTKFTRRDLLTRHWRISEHAQCAPIPATGQQTLENEHDINGAASSHVVPINNISPEQGILVHQVRPDLNDTASDLQPNQPQATLADLTANTQPEEYDDFRDFVNFIDGVGLSAQWTPEFDFDWLGINDTIHTSRRSSQAPDHRTSPEAEEIGTPFSTWLPTAPADDQIIPRPGSIENNQADKIKHGPFRVTEEQRGFLSSLLKEFQGLDPTFEIPSRHTLSRYLTAFFGGFHSHFPFIHTPTYKPTCSPIELTLAMCACGAQYCFEHKCSERLFFMAKAIVFERIQQEQSHFGPETLSSVYPRSIAMPETPAEARGLGPWTPLDLAKTILILVGYATWERKDLLSHAFHMKDVLVRVLRDLGLKEEAAPAVATTSPSARWDHWVQQESSRRTKLVAFCYINVHSIAYNVHPSLWASELHLQLPCCTAEWQATSAAHWIGRQRECKETQMPFQQALSILLSGTGTGTTHSSVHPIPSPIGNYILLHALLQRIYVVRDLAYSTTPSGSIPTQDLNLVARALRSWTSLWQQAPESILDPNNESGPIPFTSSALLVVAYVRLSLNIGPHRHLSSRNALATAKGLSELPEIEHNDNLLSALLYSTHALSIPVRLGIDRVARSQAFFWSVQHAISSFECAVFLGKWLCSLSKRSLEDENSLTRSEQRILHWVRCIIREAYAVVDFDEEERSEVEVDVGRGGHELVSLGLAVLKIWSRFFKGNTQWQFVANLGLSLEHFMRAIRATGSA